jgi:hypothetical protein
MGDLPPSDSFHTIRTREEGEMKPRFRLGEIVEMFGEWEIIAVLNLKENDGASYYIQAVDFPAAPLHVKECRLRKSQVGTETKAARKKAKR